MLNAILPVCGAVCVWHVERALSLAARRPLLTAHCSLLIARRFLFCHSPTTPPLRHRLSPLPPLDGWIPPIIGPRLVSAA
jgi:hypothetical protein